MKRVSLFKKTADYMQCFHKAIASSSSTMLTQALLQVFQLARKQREYADKKFG